MISVNLARRHLRDFSGRWWRHISQLPHGTNRYTVDPQLADLPPHSRQRNCSTSARGALSTRTVLDEAPPELIAEVDTGEITVSATSPRFRLCKDMCIERAERAQERAVRREETVSMQPYNRLSVARRSRCSANVWHTLPESDAPSDLPTWAGLRRGVRSGLYRCSSRRPNSISSRVSIGISCMEVVRPIPSMLPASRLHRRGTDAAWIAAHRTLHTREHRSTDWHDSCGSCWRRYTRAAWELAARVYRAR